MKKIIFTKEYERDLGLVVEGLWARNLSAFMSKKLGIRRYPDPFIVFYITAENMQIWESAVAISWYKDQLLKINRKDSRFMADVVSEYKNLLGQIKIYWQNGAISDTVILKKYVSLLEKAISLFALWYYSLNNKRTPKKIRDSLIKLRQKDRFFSENDLFVRRCARAFGCKNGLENFILPEEFPEIPKNESLTKRQNRGLVSIDGKIYYLMSLEEYAKKHPGYLFEGLINDSQAHEIKGQSAYNGIIEGKVRIVRNKKQMLMVKNGEILVSPMTTPDFMIAMRKASAFVTDEGGITSHAAIVAREMKKPCIIGTKIATQVLKDGDLVEVDANKGIVKIIK